MLSTLTVHARIMETLSRNLGRSTDRISVDSGMPATTVRTVLVELEQAGLVERHAGGWRLASVIVTAANLAVGDEIMVDGHPQVVRDVGEVSGQYAIELDWETLPVCGGDRFVKFDTDLPSSAQRLARARAGVDLSGDL